MVTGVYESGEGLFKVLPQNLPGKLGKTTRYFSQDSRFRNHNSNPSPLECSNTGFTRQNKLISLFNGVVSTSYCPYFVKKKSDSPQNNFPGDARRRWLSFTSVVDATD